LKCRFLDRCCFLFVLNGRQCGRPSAFLKLRCALLYAARVIDGRCCYGLFILPCGFTDHSGELPVNGTSATDVSVACGGGAVLCISHGVRDAIKHSTRGQATVICQRVVLLPHPGISRNIGGASRCARLFGFTVPIPVGGQNGEIRLA
jgi:hypothetical protein